MLGSLMVMLATKILLFLAEATSATTVRPRGEDGVLVLAITFTFTLRRNRFAARVASPL
jgi:hypothetical protein